MNETCPVHDIVQSRIEKLENKVDTLQTNHAQTFTRIDNLCSKLDKLTECINQQVKQWSQTHDDFIATRSENKVEHENFESRISKAEDYIQERYRAKGINGIKETSDQVIVNVNETKKVEKGFIDKTLLKVWDSWVGKIATALLMWMLLKWGVFGEAPKGLIKFFGGQ